MPRRRRGATAPLCESAEAGGKLLAASSTPRKKNTHTHQGFAKLQTLCPPSCGLSISARLYLCIYTNVVVRGFSINIREFLPSSWIDR